VLAVTLPADVAAWRARFPTLAARTYFATQCLGPVPEEALRDLDEYKETLLLRSRGLGRWVERMDELHGLCEQLLGAARGSVALMPSATAAHGALAASIRPTARRNRILTSTLDFHSTRYLWQAQVERGFVVSELPASHGRDGATLPAEQVIRELDDRVAIVALSLVSPRSGALLDVAPIIAAARASGARVVLDAYQAVGIVPIDVAALGVDALVGGTHKWLCGGGTGLAFLYVAPGWSATLTPVYPGWLAHRELLGFAERFVPHEGARRFQQGVPAMEPIYTARAGLRFALEVGVDRIRARNLALGRQLHDGMTALGLPVRTPAADAARGGMLVVDLPAGDAVVEQLAARGIDVDHRPGAGVRLSPHYCTSEDECRQLLSALAELAP
jgi:kynureninase